MRNNLSEIKEQAHPFIQLDKGLIGLCLEWSFARNIIHGGNAKDQALKLGSELGEVFLALMAGDREEVVDGIGDSLVVINNIAMQTGKSLVEILAENAEKRVLLRSFDTVLIVQLGLLQDALLKGQRELAQELIFSFVYALQQLCNRECIAMNGALARAYNEIKDRRGVMYNGTFIKETDPAYSVAVENIRAENESIQLFDANC